MSGTKISGIMRTQRPLEAWKCHRCSQGMSCNPSYCGEQLFCEVKGDE